MKFLGQTDIIFCINIVINYTDISGCPKKFVAVTTLYESEFIEILSYFSERWRIHESRYTLSNTWRVNKPRKDETLKLVEDKLLFILYYFKNYPIQETMGLNFGMSQGKVSVWIKVLLPILQDVLAKFGDFNCCHADYRLIAAFYGRQIGPGWQKPERNPAGNSRGHPRKTGGRKSPR